MSGSALRRADERLAHISRELGNVGTPILLYQTHRNYLSAIPTFADRRQMWATCPWRFQVGESHSFQPQE